MYFIDKFVFRVGNEKDIENEVEMVGCCLFKFEYVIFREFNMVIFDFLGKDSICFYNEFMVEWQVFKNLKLFKKFLKVDGDDIFDRFMVSFDCF